MKNRSYTSQLASVRCCFPFLKTLFTLFLAVGTFTALQGQAANDDCANAIALTVGGSGSCPGNAVGGDTDNATPDGDFSCDSAGDNAGLWYSFVAPANGEVLLTVEDLGPGNPEAAIFDACGGTEVFCDGSPDLEVVSGLTPGTTYFVVVWGDVTFGQGPFNICVEEFMPPTNDLCADAVSLTVGPSNSCPGNAVNGSTLGASDDGAQSCDATGENNGVWYDFVAPATGAVRLQVTDLGPGNPEVSIYDACGGTEVFCSTTPDDVVVDGLTAGATYQVLVWGDAGSEGPFTICLEEFVPLTNTTCSGATAITLGAPGSCPANEVSGNTNLGLDGGPQSCDSFGDNIGLWYSFVAPASGDVRLQVTDLGPGNPEASIYDACGGTEVFCSGSPDDVTVTGLTGGATYFVFVWGDSGFGQGPFTICVEEFVPPPGDNCGNAQDLATLTSPFSGTTTGYSDDEDVSCLNAAADRIFFIDVPPAATLEIGQVSNAYDSEVRIAYGGACPGDIEIDCFDDPDTKQNSWVNTTGVTQRVWWVQDAFSSFGAGDFVLEWNLIVPPPVPNDFCDDAEPIACGDVVSGTTIGASIDGDFPDCGLPITGPGVWYTFDAGDDFRFYTLSLCDDADFDTKITVYEGDDCGNLNCIGTNDDADDCGGGTSELTFTPAFNRTHYVLVHGANGEIGDFDLSLTCSGEVFVLGCTDPNASNFNPDATVDDGSCVFPPPPSGNDACAGATPVSCGQTVSGSTAGATFDGAPFCGTSNTAPGVWYAFQGDGSLVTVSTCNQANYDTKISVFTGSCSNLVCVTGDDDDPGCAGFTTEETFATNPGVTYYILIHGFGTATGDFDMTVSCAPPLTNDQCTGAQPVPLAPLGQCDNFTVPGSTIGASDDGFQTCDAFGQNNGVWYSFVAPASGIVILNVTELSGNHEAAIYSACNGSSVFCDFSPDGEQVSGLNPGQTYYLLVWSDAGSEGDHEICIEEIIAPENDACANAAPIACNTSVSGTTNFASVDNLPACGTSITAPGVWYTFTATTRIATLSTCNSANYDTKISVFSGSCTELICVGGNDDAPGCGLTSTFSFVPIIGETYYVLVHGFGSATGNFSLTYDCESFLPRSEGTVDLTAVDQPAGISLFPNPASSEINVRLNGLMGKQARIAIHNSMGQMVYASEIDEIRFDTERIDLSSLQSGIYYLGVYVDDQVYSEKFILSDSRP